MVYKVLICGEIVWAHKEIEALEKNDGWVALPLTSSSREEFFQDCSPSGKFGDIVAIYRHNNSTSQIGIFDQELVERLPKSLKFLCHNGAGYDQIDVQACTDRRIQVSNTPSAVDDATATTAMYLLLGALRGYQRAEINARAGKFKEGIKPANDPEEKVLGIVGMGGIGQSLAIRALGFSMKIQYHNRRPIAPNSFKAPLNSSNVTYVSTLQELLETSDVVSLNLPLNEKTKGSFGKREFGWMKDGSCLVNTARGAVVDEEAMLEALDSGKLKSAGLDVFPDEPAINPRLLTHPSVALLPHMGTETQESQHKMEVRALDNIVAGLKGGRVRDLVGEQVSVFSIPSSVPSMKEEDVDLGGGAGNRGMLNSTERILMKTRDSKL
ncbi:hypothetical protein BT69DRAFT_1352795 [Atractiella rhizophila]|nr:hypothetical protein BT69DRAFT_1352795 [Atractiella rhizophila]